jgi:hypothetical protein
MARPAKKSKDEQMNDPQEVEAAEDWDALLSQYQDAVNFDFDPYLPENCLYYPSPMINWIYGNSANGIPAGTGTLFFSTPKAGKSLIIQAAVAELHRRDPKAHAIIWNTELRGKYQKTFFDGIDPKRVKIFDTNRPEEIFDRFENDILPMIERGFPLKLVAFDSITMIGGTKTQAEDDKTGQVRSVNSHTVGDKALTVTKGWEKIIPILKRNNITYMGVEQMRKNIDVSNPNAPKDKMAGVFMTKHVFEYFVSITRAGSAEDKKDLAGNEFTDDSVKDARGNKLQTGHKIYFKMEESSLGPAGRAGVLTIDYKKGIVNQHEELALLGINTGVIVAAGAWYTLPNGKRCNGKKQVADAIKEDQDLAKEVLRLVIETDKDLN